MIEYSSIEIFKNNTTTLKIASRDKQNKESMTESTLNVVDFDRVKDVYAESLGLNDKPASIDALYLYENGEYFFIEFKNSSSENIKRSEIRIKICDSLLLFTDITKTNISFTRMNLNYILVYNENKNKKQNDRSNIHAKNEIIRHISQMADEHFVKFGVAGLKKLYFKNVFTYTQDAFESEFVSKCPT